MSLLSCSSFDLYCILSYYYFAMIELIKMDGWMEVRRQIAHTTAFLTRRLPVVSRTGITEYQLLLMKASNRGRNVKFLGNNFGCV